MRLCLRLSEQFLDVGAMQVQIMQADGLNELENGGRSDADDLYPNGGNVISDTSTPGLRTITGFDTGVRISNIASNTNAYSYSHCLFKFVSFHNYHIRCAIHLTR